MKRLWALCLSLVLLLAAAPARAEGADIQAYLPAEINAFFSKSAFSGYTIGSGAYVAMENTVGGSFAFAVASKGAENTLYGFEKKSGVWTYWLKTNSALPRAEGSFYLSSAKGILNWNTNQEYTQDTLVVILHQPSLDYYPHSAFFTVNASGQWHLKEMDSWLLTSPQYYHTAALVGADHISYYEEGDLIGTAWGVVETNLRYFSLSAFPGTLSAARNKLTNAPEIPYGSELTATKIKFTGGQKFEVYSGPGTGYERAANGKATVSTNDWIQVFGRENGYILIQYALNASQMRFGYITETALPKGTTVSGLSFDYDDATITQEPWLTDDPLNSAPRVRRLTAGQSGVKWLATMGSWVYIEVTGGGAPIRGFVPAWSITRMPGRKSYSASLSTGEYTAAATVDVTFGTALAATVVVNAPGSWFDGGADRVEGYQLYANNVPVAAVSSSQRTGDATSWRCTFTLSATLPAGATVVGLCPIRTTGQKAAETLILSLGN